MKKIILTGGGTAGHVYPTLAVKEALGDGYEYHYIGGNGMEKEIISGQSDITYHTIPTVKLKRKLTPENLLIPFKLLKAIREAKKILEVIKPDIIFSKGGFVAVPVAIAGAKLKIPVISHESDLSLGLANKIIASSSTKMCVSFEKTLENHPNFVFTGQPIRKQVLKGDKRKVLFGSLRKDKPNLLVVGGSTGAKFINEKVWENLDKLTEEFNIIHIAGKQGSEIKEHLNYKQLSYAQNIGDYLDFADIILSRAGSGAINEFLALQNPCF